MPDSNMLSNEELAAIAGGFHSDPFSVLGPHPAAEGVVVRTFQPASQSVRLVPHQEGVPSRVMEPVLPGSIYQVHLAEAPMPLAYSLEVTFDDGSVVQLEDPYRFPSITGPQDNRIWYERFGAHLHEIDGVAGTLFTLWAPNAERVSVVGPFNQWDGRRHMMRRHLTAGSWEIFIPGVGHGALYKFEIKTRYKGYMVNKSDPVAFFSELRPNTASIVWDIDNYDWQDEDWIARRAEIQALDQPMSVYEVHAGSWRRKGEGGWEWLTYREMADQLIPYVKEMGFTHIEFLPLAEHPFDGSWGYQVTGYYAPTSRFGTPQDLMYFIDQCHQQEIGVILDWVPAHFPKDEHGLGFFDGTYLYEHADPRQGEHPDWGTKIFNFGRGEVRKFLIDNALFWIEKYHIDGLRVDAVASMLYLDFSREPGEWVPNRYGGRENIDAIEFLRDVNTAVHQLFPGVLTIAEESTAWPGVTRSPQKEGGLGFDLKWNMGWMNDTLRYMGTDPIYRSYHQGTLTFSLLYAFSEKYLLPFSHDEVVHLKRAMVDKMPGDLWQKFANLRALFAYQFAHPGRKLNFMGNEIAQWAEWQESKSLDWSLLTQGKFHAGVQTLVRDLNHTYRSTPALYEADDRWDGFAWIDFHDALHSVIIFRRQVAADGDFVIVACNFTPQVHHSYRIGVPRPGRYLEFMNTDHSRYQGSGQINGEPLTTSDIHWNDLPQSIQVTLPPLGVIYLKPMD